jgi:hypothetical protein
LYSGRGIVAFTQERATRMGYGAAIQSLAVVNVSSEDVSCGIIHDFANLSKCNGALVKAKTLEVRSLILIYDRLFD